tara:strand:- start:2093 stop:2353 length:261 start_codon:yes stop_codon:yes gene_type:complete
MPTVAINGNLAGGATTGLTKRVLINGKSVVCIGSLVASHGTSPHDAATITEGNTGRVTMEGKVPSVSGNKASCVHKLVGTSNVTIG